MKVMSILLLIASLLAWPRARAEESRTVSFTGKDVPLEKIFASVKKQTGYGFFYSAAALEGVHAVTIDVKNIPIETFLEICLRDLPLSFKIVGETVFIQRKSEKASVEVPGDENPGNTVKGRVTNSHGEPLVNANVVIKRSARGTVTNANGEFTLKSLQPDDVIMVSYIGYKQQTIALKGRSSLSLVMDPTSNELDKVVVQAYGTTSQRLATGSIGSVRAEEIAKQPVMNVLEAVQGQIAGVSVTNTSGYESGTIKVEIRGRNTINSNFPSDPLYIIDGVPLTILDLTGQSNYSSGAQGFIQSSIPSPANGQSPFFSINPADIESIEVLKDADATAIYGSRGANGVILVTTKKGRAGKTHLDINVYTGISKIPVFYHMLNTQQYVAMRKEALANDGLPVDASNAPDLLIWDTTRYTDWQKYLWGGTGKVTDIETSLSGGDLRTNFRLGAGYHTATSVLTNNGSDQRGSFSINLNHKTLDQRFNMALSANYSYSVVDLINTPGAITLPPNTPPAYDSKGNLNYNGWQPLNYYFPFAPLLQPYSSKTNFLNSSLSFSYEAFKGFTIRSNVGYNNARADQTSTIPIASQDPSANPTGGLNLGYSYVHNIIFEPQAEYNAFINKGKLNVLLGASIQTNSTSAAYMTAGGFTNDVLLTSVGNGPVQYSNNTLAEYKYQAIFARINYNWKDKYILNLNARRDGSSKFGPGRQFGNFGSFGAAWIFTEEKGMKNLLPFLSFGKLRGSYGTTGGDQIGQYAFLSQWIFTNPTLYNNTLPLIPMGHTDSTLHWQVNHKMEIALDLSFLNDRINFEASWYRNRTDNQLVNFPTPTFTGFVFVVSNSPANVENQGWEFTLNSKNIDTKTFRWSTRFNIGLNRNKLLSYPNLAQSPYANSLVVGKPLNITKVLHYLGANPQTGDYQFQDLNKDGQITIDYSYQSSDDRYVLDVTPKYDGGVTNTVGYKNWELSFFFFFRKQIGRNVYGGMNVPGQTWSQPDLVLKRWQKPGDITNIAKFTTQTTYNYNLYQGASDAIYSDASFIRLQNLSLAYTLSGKSIKNTGISNIKIYLQAQNLFTITDYNGIDPELQGFGSLPMVRTITAGLSCNF